MKTDLETRAIMHTRLAAFIFFILGLSQAIARTLESFDEINPVYIVFFVQTRLAEPVVLVLAALATAVASRRIGHMLAKNLGAEKTG